MRRMLKLMGTRNDAHTQSQLESYLLRGDIDACDYKQFIFPLLFFKRMCDVYDEEYALALEESDVAIKTTPPSRKPLLVGTVA